MQVRLPLGALRCEFCTAYHPKEMIEVFEKPDAACCQRLRNDLTSLGHLLVEHDPRWLTVLNAGLGQRPYLLLDRSSDGNLCGYLPLALVSGRLFGSFLVSLPYLNHCGVVSNNAKTRMALIDAAVKLADRLDVQYLELRHINPVPSDQLAVQRDDKPLMILDLPSGKKDLWSVIGSKVRNQIRKGQKKDLSIVWGGQELIGEFYNVFAINMRDLGTPVYPRRLFSLMMTQFKQEAEVAVVRYGDRPVAGALLITMGGTTQVPSASSLRRYAATCANMWMYHQLLCRAIDRGSRRFDFGRSSEGSGTYRFKEQWGAKPLATVWQYYVRRGDINIVRPDSPQFKRRIAFWQRLPVWLTRLVGPPIVRGIP